jgi:8-oxo-dGTP pyrophosphatase MutT (NUDIX family)
MKYVYRLAYRVLMVYWFFVRPHTQGVKCLVQSGGRILLVRHTYGRGNWTLPGGGLKRTETRETAARREVWEEVGITLSSLKKVGEFFSRREFKHDSTHCFTAIAQGTAITRDPKEIAVAAWFPLDALPSPRSEVLEYTLAVSQALDCSASRVSPLADETEKRSAGLPAS